MNTKTLLLFLYIMAGCSPNGTEDPIIVADVEKEFNIYPREVLNTSSPKELEWVIISKNTEPCQNYEIKARLEKNSTDLSLFIDEITNPEDCIVGEVVPSLILNSGKINQTTYNFNITLKKTIENQGHLKKTDNRYSIQIGSENGIDLQHKELISIPNTVLWGYVGLTKGSEGDQLSHTMTQLKNNWEPMTLSSGFYGHFLIMPGSSYNPSLMEQPEFDSYRTFLLDKKSEDSESIQRELDVLKDVIENPDIQIVLFDNAGNIYN